MRQIRLEQKTKQTNLLIGRDKVISMSYKYGNLLSVKLKTNVELPKLWFSTKEKVKKIQSSKFLIINFPHIDCRPKFFSSVKFRIYCVLK